MPSIELKFGKLIAGHRRKNPIDFVEYRMYSIFTGVQERILIHIEILAVSSLFKYLIAIKCSESREETLQIFVYLFTKLKCLFITISNNNLYSKNFCYKHNAIYLNIAS